MCKKISFIVRTGFKYERGTKECFKGCERNKGTFYTYVLQHFIYDHNVLLLVIMQQLLHNSVSLRNGNFDNDFQCKKCLLFTRSQIKLIRER
jgi:hypothetical protein